MAAYLFPNDGLPIFDATGDVITLNSEGQPVCHIKNVVTITNVDGLSNDGASPPRAIPKLAMTIQVADPI